MIITIPKAKIKRTAMYVNTDGLTMAQAKERTGADVIVNGGFYSPLTSALVSGGKEYRAMESYGYALGESVVWSWANNVRAGEYIGAYPALVRNGEVLRDGWSPELSAATRRTAVGLKPNGDLVIACGVVATLPAIASAMTSAGCENAINLDGGGSSQMISPEGTVKSTDFGGDRIVHNMLCVWLRDSGWGGTREGRATTRIKTLDSSGTPENGRYIDAGDVCDISEYAVGDLFRVTYPTPSGPRTAYLASLDGFVFTERKSLAYPRNQAPEGRGVSLRTTEALMPYVAYLAAELVRESAKEGIPVLITATMRDAEYQQYCKDIGASSTAQIGAHAFGLAFDVCINEKGHEYDAAKLGRVGAIGKALGLVWGGDWKSFPDMPHFEYTGGLTNAELRAGKRPILPIVAAE